MNKMIIFCLERMRVVRIIVHRSSSEDVHDGRLAGFYIMTCAVVFVCRFIWKCRRR